MPTNTEILSALGTGGNCLRTRKSLQPLKRPNGEYYFSTGNFSLVVKMHDTANGKYYAMKCFTKLHPKLIDSYALIGKHIQMNQSPYLVHYEFCDNEIWVISELDGKKGYPVVIMEWIEGKTLGCYLAELVSIADKEALFQLACRFDAMSLWLLEQSFAHGDLKTDNILVDPFGRLRLIDYDGMFTPEMQNQHARENGSPGFRHPKRLQEHFGPHIDDFSILIISLSLHALAFNPSLAGIDNSFSDSILFTEEGLCKPEHSIWQLFETLRDNSHVAQRLVMLQMAVGNPATMRLFGIKPILKGTASLAHLVTDNEDIHIEMIYIIGGTFQMGSNESTTQEPVHSVTVSDFYMGKYEVTQDQWKTIMGNNPSHNQGDNLPVVNVSWNDVQAFLCKLNSRTGMNYRLSTEAEWEYAARGGIKSLGYKFAGSNTLNDVGWYYNNTFKDDDVCDSVYNFYIIHEIGSKQPNELGIYDMSGNVWEWCYDWYGEYSSKVQNNPSGSSSGTRRVNRGGDSTRNAILCHVAHRASENPNDTYECLGFRLALSK